MVDGAPLSSAEPESLILKWTLHHVAHYVYGVRVAHGNDDDDPGDSDNANYSRADAKQQQDDEMQFVDSKANRAAFLSKVIFGWSIESIERLLMQHESNFTASASDSGIDSAETEIAFLSKRLPRLSNHVISVTSSLLICRRNVIKALQDKCMS